jgi:hypothetical protein
VSRPGPPPLCASQAPPGTNRAQFSAAATAPGEKAGTLQGVPVTAKDLVDVADVRARSSPASPPRARAATSSPPTARSPASIRPGTGEQHHHRAPWTVDCGQIAIACRRNSGWFPAPETSETTRQSPGTRGAFGFERSSPAAVRTSRRSGPEGLSLNTRLTVGSIVGRTPSSE